MSSIDNASGLRWSEREHALPMPTDWKDEVTALAVRSSDLLDAPDQEKLRVSGLAAGNCTLKIDGQTVGDYCVDQLAQGVNLAEYSTANSQAGGRGAQAHHRAQRHLPRPLAHG